MDSVDHFSRIFRIHAALVRAVRMRCAPLRVHVSRTLTGTRNPIRFAADSRGSGVPRRRGGAGGARDPGRWQGAATSTSFSFCSLPPTPVPQCHAARSTSRRSAFGADWRAFRRLLCPNRGSRPRARCVGTTANCGSPGRCTAPTQSSSRSRTLRSGSWCSRRSTRHPGPSSRTTSGSASSCGTLTPWYSWLGLGFEHWWGVVVVGGYVLCVVCCVYCGGMYLWAWISPRVSSAVRARCV